MTEIVSGTQLDHWNRCQRLYYYAHDLQIAPIEVPWPLAVGKAGHVMLATYYNARQLGADHATAAEMVREQVSFEADIMQRDPKVLGFALRCVGYYWAKVGAEDGLLIVGVEWPARQERDGWIYAATLDLLVRSATTGELEVWDHRFLYDPYGPEMARLDSQLPRYITAASAVSGEIVRTGVRNMTSTAPEKELAKANRGRVRRVQVDTTPTRLMIVGSETDRTARQILAWRQLPLEVRAQATRTVIPGERYPACKTCSFFNLCVADGWGEDTSKLRAEKFGPSDYGYEEVATG
jgi:PD-(D/E)XK nuclease superfamily protein